MRRVGLCAIAVVACCILASLRAQAPAAASPEVERLVEKLGATDARERSDAYMQLQRMRSPDNVPLLAKRLPGWPLASQSFGMYLLQGQPIDATRPVYQRLLQEKSAFLRGASAAALYRSGEKGAAAALASAITASDDMERMQVLGRLWGIDDVRVRDAVRGLVRVGASERALEDALYHLLSVGPGPDAATVRAAETVLGDAGTGVAARATCAAFLLAAGIDKHGPALAATLGSDPNALTRLRRFLDRAPRIGPDVEDALVGKLLAAKSAFEVTWPAQTLEKHAADKAVGALRELLRAKEDAVRKAALETLASIPRALQAHELRAMLAHEDPETALVAADAMRRMDDGSGIDRVVELVGKQGAHRLTAVRALGQFRARAAVPVLLDALADGDRNVRDAAFLGLQRILPALFPYRRFDLQSTGYAPDGADDRRAAGLAALRAWWAAR